MHPGAASVSAGPAAHPGPGGAAATNAVLELGEQLVGERIEKVTLEATSDYWRIWFYLLEAVGLDVQLVDAHDVKQAPGRPKSDKLDAVWLAKLTERGMLRPSFVPPAEIRNLRDIQSGATNRAGRTGKGNPYLKGALGEAAAAAARTDTFFGERHRRIVKRRGKLKALVAVGPCRAADGAVEVRAGWSHDALIRCGMTGRACYACDLPGHLISRAG